MNDSLKVGSVFSGRFRIEAVLGSGGMGAVYQARHEVLRRAVAIKVLHRSLLGNPNILARFEREARAASRVEHPHVTSIVDFGHSEEGVPYLVMELVRGPTLSTVLDHEGAMPVGRALGILGQIADALVAAHAVGVIHRDLKPANMILVPDQPDLDFVKICDFGLAKIVDPEEGDMGLSTEGLGFGTPEYMSPEHCAGAPVDHRADIYAFGLVAFALLTGRPPFTGPRQKVTAAQLRKAPPDIASQRGKADVPPALQHLISRCLCKRAEGRWQSSVELSRQLDLLRPTPLNV